MRRVKWIKGERGLRSTVELNNMLLSQFPSQLLSHLRACLELSGCRVYGACGTEQHVASTACADLDYVWSYRDVESTAHVELNIVLLSQLAQTSSMFRAIGM